MVVWFLSHVTHVLSKDSTENLKSDPENDYEGVALNYPRKKQSHCNLNHTACEQPVWVW